MGEAKRRGAKPALLNLDLVERVGLTLRKLATASSSHLGSDCYLHAAIGQVLLAENGVTTEIAGGFAAWRTGQSDGSVISHTEREISYVPAGSKGFPYHVWLVAGRTLIDFTTYQLVRKARELDAADGGHTEVDWCPDLLVTDRSSISSYRQVAQGDTGLFYYERQPRVEAMLSGTFTLAPEDVDIARIIFSAPDVMVVGPNHVKP